MEPNIFEKDIQRVLETRRLKMIPRWHDSGCRIELVVQHPQQKDAFVLEIECDGATYHSSEEARIRDQLRQCGLEAPGCRFHRSWSTNWLPQFLKEFRCPHCLKISTGVNRART